MVLLLGEYTVRRRIDTFVPKIMEQMRTRRLSVQRKKTASSFFSTLRRRMGILSLSRIKNTLVLILNTVE